VTKSDYSKKVNVVDFAVQHRLGGVETKALPE
jgi:hypothetical protein